MKPGKNGMTGRVVLVALLLGAAIAPFAYGYWDLPPLLPPDRYGNILINRTSTKNGVKPATFSHWIHRRKHTCRVCHFEIEFNMKKNTTAITEQGNKAGKFCGTSGCHDGKVVFGHEKPHCEKCHNGNIGYGGEKFAELSDYPATPLGNRVDWVAALRGGMISPLRYLKEKPVETAFEEKLSIEAEWNFVPPSIFPHKAHTEWLDCNNCHPEIFTIKKKGTEGFSMNNILEGEFCGVCHLNVAFPMDDCQRCHPGIKSGM